SRRRHTRWPRDWSSDVCSSDLYALSLKKGDETVALELARLADDARFIFDRHRLLRRRLWGHGWQSTSFDEPARECLLTQARLLQIGRASCREGGERSGVGRLMH